MIILKKKFSVPVKARRRKASPDAPLSENDRSLLLQAAQEPEPESEELDTVIPLTSLGSTSMSVVPTHGAFLGSSTATISSNSQLSQREKDKLALVSGDYTPLFNRGNTGWEFPLSKRESCDRMQLDLGFKCEELTEEREVLVNLQHQGANLARLGAGNNSFGGGNNWRALER